MNLYLYNVKKVGQPFFLLIFCVAFLLINKKATAQNKITRKNITFISYPNFPEGHSTWDDIGFNSTNKKVYVAVTNHHDKQALFVYDTQGKTMRYKGLVGDLAHLRTFQWQGKVHSKFVEGPDGDMYFATDGGESREEYLMNHPHGYGGGFFMKWDPKNQKVKNLGMGLKYESIKDVDIDPETGNIYGISYPQVHFLLYDVEKNKVQDLGRLGSSHVPRVLFTDKWGNCYYVDWRQRLVKYEKSKKELIFAKNSLPAFSNTPGTAIVTGITAYAKDPANNTIYLVTYGAKMLAFHPQKEGIGKVVDLGGVVDTNNKNQWKPYVPNLNLGDNGKLYYIVGGHGNFVKKNKTVLLEFNPKTRSKRILFEYPTSEITEATGSDIKDEHGNLYFAARKYDKNHSSVPFMIKFNPEKEVQR